MAFLTWTIPSTSSQSALMTGNREWPVLRASAKGNVRLLLPIAGLARGTLRTLRWAPLTQAPAIALAVTEVLANPAARIAASLTLALLLLAFAAVIAAQRAASRG